MKKYIYIFGAIALVIILPIAFKRTNLALPKYADDTLVIITPHPESIRTEMDLGFREWYYKKTGRTVKIDWRITGSTGEVIRYIDSIYINAFQLYWENTLHEVWDQEVQKNFINLNPKGERAKKIREAFLNSNVSCGIDLLFGGGVVEHKKEADMGQLVPSDLIQKHPEWFCDNCIPAQLSGDNLYDPNGVWYGTSLASFGIIYNTDRVADLKLPHAPSQWIDLISPKLYHQIAMVDPVQSSIVIKCLEMMIQQQMKFVRSDILTQTKQTDLTKDQLQYVLNKGWINGLKMIQKIMANSRYFTDNSVTTVWDVAMGNCSVGIVVDFYGRHQREDTRARSGSDRFHIILPKGGTTLSPDPISMFRGAKHKDVAEAFMEYVLSKEGQERIGFKTGTPNGPQYYALHRTPLRKDFYVEENKKFMSTPEMNPFLEEDEFPYQYSWTGTAFSAIRILSKVLFMDPFTELSKAWKAIIDAQAEGRMAQAESALAVMEDLNDITYDWVFSTLIPNSKNPLQKISLETELTKKFRQKYIQAYQIATQK